MPNNLGEDGASCVPIPDIFILGAPHNPVHYHTRVFLWIALHWIAGYQVGCVVWVSLKRKICFACAVVYFMLCGGRVRFGGAWNGVVWYGVHGSVETAGMMWSSVDQCGPVHCSVVVWRQQVWCGPADTWRVYIGPSLSTVSTLTHLRILQNNLILI